MQCLKDDELGAWLEGACDETTTLAVEAHLHGCPACEALVAALVGAEDAAQDRSQSAAVPRRGGSLGRYRILDVLGTGAMGVVYAARDEALDRTVAIKLLGSPAGTSPEAAARLEREAQAMARLSHPNVVAVYEIGTYEGAPFVAMEHVDGVTLSEWLRDQRPTIDEIVRLFREAAIGLHAVHRAGLVHRDFKPANVLVSRDGRVRIADFGLVHLAAGSASTPLDGSAPTQSLMTAEGAVIGTPAYLAPEQLCGRVDARSDQFSFFVALFEACFGQRPFQTATLRELGAAVRSGELRLPKALPRSARWLLPILRRGMAYDPAARFPDLDAVADALSRSPARRRRRALVGAGVLAGLGTIAFGMNAGRGPDCAKVGHALDGIWDTQRRDAIRSAFESSPSPRAAQAWDKVSIALDAYAAAWTRRRQEACLSPGKDDATRGLVAARVACLDRRRAELRVLSELLANSDIDAAEKATRAITELRSPESCDAEATAVGDLSADEQSVLERVAEVRLLSLVGQHKAALDLARKALPAAALARPAIRAKALLRSGQAELASSLDVAIAQLRQAALLAETAREDEVRAEALAYLAYAMSQRVAEADLALGEQYAEQATAVLARLGGDRRLDPLLLDFKGLLLAARERYDEAVAQLERALALLDGDPAGDARLRGRVLGTLGTTLSEMGRPEDGLPYLERALALVEESMGPRSPAMCASLLNLGEDLLRLGRTREAVAYVERGAALAELGWGADSRVSAYAARMLGTCRAQQGDAAAARPLLERAVTIASGLQPGDGLRFDTEVALGRHLTQSGETKRGLALLEQALRDGAPGPEHLAQARFALAQALPRDERKRARELATEARATYALAGARRANETAAIDAWLARVR